MMTVFKQAKAVHALDGMATVIGTRISLSRETIQYSQKWEMTTATREGM
jgi:hypothetical protein